MKWHKVTEQLPEPGINIIGLNNETGEMEFGFRSKLDTENKYWLYFSFALTHLGNKYNRITKIV